MVRLYEFMDTVSRANYHNIGPASIGPSATFTSHLNAHGSSFLPNRASSSSMHGFSSPFAGIADRYDASVGGSSILVSGTNTGSDSGLIGLFKLNPQLKPIVKAFSSLFLF